MRKLMYIAKAVKVDCIYFSGCSAVWFAIR